MRAVLYGIVSCVLLCALLVTAATRTEVGRDALGQQVESWVRKDLLRHVGHRGPAGQPA